MKINREFELPFKGCEKCIALDPIFTNRYEEMGMKPINFERPIEFYWTCKNKAKCEWGARMAKAEGV